MTFISYAQNYEDIMLWRALKNIKNGFYIDIGAWSPDVDSVTKLFYKAGWRGINVEPNPDYINLYCEKRKEDINLCVAVSDKAGEGEMYFVSNPGLSSLDRSIAEGHSSLGWETSPTIVKIRTLAHICEEYCVEKDIHFLKVDVEGYEDQVLRGNDWLRFRPWVVVVESTLPMSQTENYEDWELILLDANYILAYADGLNRFYISKEHEELLSSFKYPPNVFDEFKLISEIQAETQAKQAEAKAEQAEAKAEQLHTELHSVYTSRSWRITAPLRWFIHQVRLLRQHGLFSRIKALIKKIVHLFILRSIVFVDSRPRLQFRLVTLIRKLGLDGALRYIYLRFSKNSFDSMCDDIAPLTFEDLTPHARRIYAELKNEIERQHQGNP